MIAYNLEGDEWLQRLSSNHLFAIEDFFLLGRILLREVKLLMLFFCSFVHVRTTLYEST